MRSIMRAVAAALVLLAIGVISVVSVKANAGGESKPPRKSSAVDAGSFSDDPFGAPAPTTSAAEAGKTPSPPRRRTSIAVYPTEPAKIVRALEEPARMQFVDFTMGEVVEYLRHLHKIPISLDLRALEEYDIGSDLPITFSADGISLHDALSSMLGRHDLTYTIRNEELIITTPSFVEADLRIKIYDVADLIVCREESPPAQTDYAPLIHLFTTTVDPKSWSTAGGLGTIVGYDLGSARILVVGHTYHGHRKIDALLDALRAVSDSP